MKAVLLDPGFALLGLPATNVLYTTHRVLRSVGHYGQLRAPKLDSIGPGKAATGRQNRLTVRSNNLHVTLCISQRGARTWKAPRWPQLGWASARYTL